MLGKLAMQAPKGILAVCGTVVIVTLIASVTLLTYAGRDPGPTTQLIQTILTALSTITSGGALIYAGSAASSAHTAKEQTNGAMDARLRKVVRAEIGAALGDGAQVVDPGYPDESADKGH